MSLALFAFDRGLRAMGTKVGAVLAVRASCIVIDSKLL